MHRIIILVIILLLLSMPHRTGAAGMDIGMSTWFCWWQPSWNNGFSSYKVTPAFFYGPGLSFRLPGNVTVSSNFLYARVKAEGRMILAPPSKMNRVIRRYDSDSTLSYTFTRFFKLFAGFKYSYYSYQESSPMFMPGSMFQLTIDKKKYNEYAPALGIGFTIHLVDHLYVMIHASCVYMFTSVEKDSRVLMSVSGMSPLFFIYPRKNWSVNKMGANAQLALAYFIKPINTSISIGFRYQFYKTVKSDTQEDQYTHYYDHFYGINASVIYRIDFEKKKDQAEDDIE